MNVRLAAQTLSSSVADAIEFLEASGYPSFVGASATVRFIRKVDRLFDLLNSRNPYGKGFKAPIRKHDQALWTHVIDSTTSYLAGMLMEQLFFLIEGKRSLLE